MGSTPTQIRSIQKQILALFALYSLPSDYDEKHLLMAQMLKLLAKLDTFHKGPVMVDIAKNNNYRIIEFNNSGDYLSPSEIISSVMKAVKEIRFNTLSTVNNFDFDNERHTLQTRIKEEQNMGTGFVLESIDRIRFTFCRYSNTAHIGSYIKSHKLTSVINPQNKNDDYFIVWCTLIALCKLRPPHPEMISN